MSVRAITTVLAIACCVPAAASEQDNPELGQFRPEPLEPVRVYTYPDDYEKYYGGAEPIPPFKFEVDDTRATFDISSHGDWDSRKLYPDFVSAYEDTAKRSDVRRIIPSLELVGYHGKFFDEGAYAAAEFRLDEGTPAVPGGRVGFYGRLAAALAGRYETASGPAKDAYADAAAYVATGVALVREDGKVPESLGLPPEIAARAEDQATAFLRDFPEISKPIGFYTWSKDLRRVWAHRKWFQLALGTGDENIVALALALTATLQNEPALQAEYDAILAAHAGLTNPAKLRDCNDVAAVVGDAAAALDDVPAVRYLLERDPNANPFNPNVFSFLPPAMAVEEGIWEAIGLKLKSDDDLYNFVIDAVTESGFTFKPGSRAGWYQHQQYALEVFLKLREAAEGRKLEIRGTYYNRLRYAFRALLAMSREIHIGGLTTGVVASLASLPPTSVTVYVRPEVSLEPVPTYYLRVARNYGFLQKTLKRHFGAGAPGEMRRVREEGIAEDNLTDELADLRDLHYGLYLESCANIGLTPELEPGEVDEPAKAISRAQRWLADWRNDPLMKKDIRVIIPVGAENPLEPEPYRKCWAIVGVETERVEIEYYVIPECRIVEGDVKEGDGPGEVEFEPASIEYFIITPRVIEVTVPGAVPFDRDEFRKFCDRYDTASEIAEALSRREPTGRKKTVVHEKLRDLITAESTGETQDN